MHDVIQIVMGWLECYLHEFRTDQGKYTEITDEAEADEFDEAEFRRGELVGSANSIIRRRYVLGNFWDYEIVVESSQVVPAGNRE